MPAGAPMVSSPVRSDEFAELQASAGWTRRQQATLAAARWLGPALLRGLGFTWRFELPKGLPPHALDATPPAAIYVFWHRCLLPIAWKARGRGYGVLISHHYDGEIVAQVAGGLGYRLFRGSSTRGGREAVEAMTAALRAGRPVALTVDGPRGPRFQAKAGAVQLARMTGLPIYALHAAPEHSWTLRSWDRFQLPRPGSRIRGYWAGPLYVSREAGPEEIELRRQEMESTLNRLRTAGEIHMKEEST